MKEYIVRLVYCEMLGHEVEFGYIHAVKFASETNPSWKRIGYLAVSLLLNESHELILLLINTLQRDLRSTNLAEVRGGVPLAVLLLHALDSLLTSCIASLPVMV